MTSIWAAGHALWGVVPSGRLFALVWLGGGPLRGWVWLGSDGYGMATDV
ncbi:MAG: hypothetical protein JO240_14105 [Solirubrobacterales bacterium]|nr:hypothetical protein [Solirubrobacterales bacterium]